MRGAVEIRGGRSALGVVNGHGAVLAVNFDRPPTKRFGAVYAKVVDVRHLHQRLAELLGEFKGAPGQRRCFVKADSATSLQRESGHR